MTDARTRSLATALPLALAIALGATTSRADTSIIHEAGHPIVQHFEIEPHGLVAWGSYYGTSAGFGPGLRVSIVVAQRAFIPRINNSIAISFGGDFIYYPDCYWRYYGYYGWYNGSCNTWVLFFPAALQWNFFLTRHWSVFAEPGIAFYYGIFDDPCANYPCSQYWVRPSHFGISFAGWIGARYHFNDHVALTMRVGYPSASIGVSFY